jgi:glycosyltransferase involved in cell wall biosynthesis
MTLDVVIPTYNRADLLGRTLESLLAAEPPDAMAVQVAVVDNRSTDGTRAAVESFLPRFAGRLHYLYEPIPGRSSALNCGIDATSGDLVAMIDDDEEVDRTWLRCIERAFADPGTDFIGGPYIPRWVTPRPEWLPLGYRSAIGWVDNGPEIRQYGPSFAGMLMGGNAVIRRTALTRVGRYAANLGRTGTRLLSCEDDDMFSRLLTVGARGFYRPDLIIHHYIAPERVTRGYFRRWSFWRGVSLGTLHRQRPAPVVHVLGIPRYMIGTAMRGMFDTVRRLFRREDAARRFTNELALWDLAGFVYGRHWNRSRNGSAVKTESAPPVADGAVWRQVR